MELTTQSKDEKNASYRILAQLEGRSVGDSNAMEGYDTGKKMGLVVSCALGLILLLAAGAWFFKEPAQHPTVVEPGIFPLPADTGPDATVQAGETPGSPTVIILDETAESGNLSVSGNPFGNDAQKAPTQAQSKSQPPVSIAATSQNAKPPAAGKPPAAQNIAKQSRPSNARKKDKPDAQLEDDEVLESIIELMEKELDKPSPVADAPQPSAGAPDAP